MAKKKTFAGFVTKDMEIGEAVSRWPIAAEIMAKHGLHCIGCQLSPFETIGAGAAGHGLTQEAIEKMVEEINNAIGQAGKAAKSAKQAAGPLTALQEKQFKAP